MDAIDALPLSDAQERVLGMSAIYAVDMTARALDEVSDRSGASAR